MSRRLRWGTLFLLGLLALPGLGHAACTISIATLSFTYPPLSGTPTKRTSTVTITCTALSGFGGYTIALNAGTSGTFSNRRMTGTGFNLPYQLYSDSAYSVIWGNGTSGTMTVTSASATPFNGGTDTYTVYGEIAANVAVAPGSYTDTVTTTLTY